MNSLRLMMVYRPKTTLGLVALGLAIVIAVCFPEA